MKQRTIADLCKELAELKTELQWMRQVLAINRFDGPWLSPAEAEPIIGVSRDRIMDEVKAAERLRLAKKKSDLVYGEHYFNAMNPHEPGVRKPTWKIHFVKFGEVVKRPPEERKVG